ncbi:Codeine O-demethylase [Sesamum angolense]|uniref:Codeine O-demethylase n=1 Tax=Sesamum angolense TaxID=2727404 RepID=A0AAE1WDV3_9LAMI|nr:Codeine O-demethylase [Sesamum angolense]
MLNFKHVGFQAVNHGIENSFLDQMRQLAREFFHLPTGEKQKYARPSDGFEGYGNDMVLFDNQSLDWVDRDMLYDYTARLRQVEEQLLKSMAKSLSLPEDNFMKQLGEQSTMAARFNYYPPCARADVVVGLKPHTDASMIISNGIFKSRVHRALTNSTRERNTLAMFYGPDPEQEIGPVEELVDEKRPRAFKNIKNYVQTFFYYCQKGKRPIDAVRV